MPAPVQLPTNQPATAAQAAAALGVPESSLEPRLRGVFKVDPTQVKAPERGRVVLVTAMTPTPAGEGKTTTTIGLVDGLRHQGVNAIGALREPSLGPLFGMKGGAVGGGKSRVMPDDAINMHFTGDIHAVTSAHNLLAAVVDNHVYFDRTPRMKTVTWGRVLDMNDRALRSVEVGHGSKHARVSRFDITAASEVMAILCLSSDLRDLRARLDRIIVGVDESGAPVTAKDVEASGAMAAILMDAMRPNLVTTLEGSPVLLHGGPFANVAQGTSSLSQTRLARRCADVVVTEAGFAFDLGGVKFLDVKCRQGGFLPAAVVLVATIRALRFHGGNADFSVPDVDAVRRGLDNIAAHAGAMERLGLRKPILSLNRFPDDQPAEVEAVVERCRALGVRVTNGTYFADGGKGAQELASAVMHELGAHSDDNGGYRAPYALEQSVPAKIEALAKTALGARDVVLTDAAKADLALIEGALSRLGTGGTPLHLPLCLAKTHLSISDDAKVKGQPPPFTLTVTGLRLSAGAGFIVVLCGPILTMPGLPKVPQAAHIELVLADDGTPSIRGIK